MPGHIGALVEAAPAHGKAGHLAVYHAERPGQAHRRPVAAVARRAVPARDRLGVGGRVGRRAAGRDEEHAPVGAPAPVGAGAGRMAAGKPEQGLGPGPLPRPGASGHACRPRHVRLPGEVADPRRGRPALAGHDAPRRQVVRHPAPAGEVRRAGPAGGGERVAADRLEVASHASRHAHVRHPPAGPRPASASSPTRAASGQGAWPDVTCPTSGTVRRATLPPTPALPATGAQGDSVPSADLLRALTNKFPPRPPYVLSHRTQLFSLHKKPFDRKNT